MKAQGFMDQFIDKDDGWLDASQFLEENAFGFLPVVFIITEPAIGDGLGVAGIKLFRPQEGDPEPREGEFPVTDMAAAAAAYTESGTWFVGGQYFNTYRGDTRRYTGTVGYADATLDWYGGQRSAFDNGFEFNAKGAFIDQKLLFRMGESDWFIGGDYRYINSDVTFELALPIPLPSLASSISGLSVVALYEKLNSRLSPTEGLSAEFSAQVNDEAIGSDFDYEEFAVKIRKYFLFGDKFTLGLRLDGSTTNGDVPFYLKPFITMEGIPSLRYQGSTALTAEIRGGWNFHPRWTAMAFAGGGRTGDKISDLSSATTDTSRGVGFRYLLAKAFGIQAGLDYAKGPEGNYIYLVFGNAWR